jgi:hypothetical protein
MATMSKGCGWAQVTQHSADRRSVFKIIFNGATASSGPGPPHYWGFTITLTHTTLGRIPLVEWSARRRDLYLTTHNTHKRQTFMPPVGFEPKIPASERPQTHALDRAATGIGDFKMTIRKCAVNITIIFIILYYYYVIIIIIIVLYSIANSQLTTDL